MSRNLMALERVLGVRLLHRTSRSITPTTAGVRILAQARQILAAADNLVAEATTGHTTLRIGHAWSAMGRHTSEFQRRWAARYPGVELHLIRTNSPTGVAGGLVAAFLVSVIPAMIHQFQALVHDFPHYFASLQERSARLRDLGDRFHLTSKIQGFLTNLPGRLGSGLLGYTRS